MVSSILTSQEPADLAAPSRFCATHDIFHIDICVLLSYSDEDPSSYHFAFSGLFRNGRGWAAFGRGHIMDRALMFVVYPNQQNKGLTVGVRSTSGHNPPTISRLASNLSVARNYSDENGYYNVEIECASCRTPPEEQSSSIYGEEERWIWSANDYQSLLSDSASEDLHMHMAYGKFTTLMRSTNGEHLTSFDLSGRVNVFSWAEGSVESHSDGLLRMHGLIMIMAFVALYPLGILGIKHGMKKSFLLHSRGQAFTTSCVVLAAFLGVWHSISRVQTPAMVAHEICGVLILATIFTQISLGVLHHRHYKITHRRTAYAHWHRPIGYIILLGGIGNCSLGLSIAGTFSNAIKPLGMALCTYAVWATASVLLERRAQATRRGGRCIERHGTIAQDDEGDQPLLEETVAVDEEDEREDEDGQIIVHKLSVIA